MTFVQAIRTAREVSARVGIPSVVYRYWNGYGNRLMLKGSGQMHSCTYRWIVGADGYIWPYKKAEQMASYTYEVKL